MQLGLVGLPVPAHIKSANRLYWDVQRVADLGGQIAGASAWHLDVDEGRHVREFADSKGAALESCVAWAFSLCGSENSKAHEALARSLDAAGDLGGSVVHCSYGRLEVATSRFNREMPRICQPSEPMVTMLG